MNHRILGAWALALGLLACGPSDPPEEAAPGAQPERSATDGAGAPGQDPPSRASAIPHDDVFALHEPMLRRRMGMSDLDGDALRVAQACRAEPRGQACQRGRSELSTQQWRDVQQVLSDLAELEDEFAERLELCRAGDEDALRARYPGHFDFWQRVASRPPSIEEPMDAAVVVSIAGSLSARPKTLLEQGMVEEALRVQVRSPGSSSGFSPNEYAQRRNTTPNLYLGHYTGRVKRMMNASRPDCDRLKNSAYMQGACRRDLTVAIIRDWLDSRGHRSVRVVLNRQTTWPEFAVLFERNMPDFDVRIDPDFRNTVPRRSTFMGEICGSSTESLWTDYEFFAKTLLADG